MDIEKFRTAREKFLTGKRFSGPEEYRQAWKGVDEAAAPEHVGKNIGAGMFDQVECSCGRIGKSYFDGAEYAWDDWREHVADVMGLIYKKCPCGKTYLPADGKKPCHELRPFPIPRTKRPLP